MLALFSLPAYGQTIAAIACDSANAAKFSTLCTAVQASTTVANALSATGTYTVFATTRLMLFLPARSTTCLRMGPPSPTSS